MSNNSNRKVADAPFIQSKLNFGKTQKVLSSNYIEQVEPSQSFIECTIFSFDIVKYKSICQVETFELFRNNDHKPKYLMSKLLIKLPTQLGGLSIGFTTQLEVQLWHLSCLNIDVYSLFLKKNGQQQLCFSSLETRTSKVKLKMKSAFLYLIIYIQNLYLKLQSIFQENKLMLHQCNLKYIFTKDKPQLVDCEIQTNQNELTFQYNIIEYSFPFFKKIEIQQNVLEPQIEKQQDEENNNKNKEILKCNECNIIFDHQHTLHRHFEKYHQENHNIFIMHEKINGRYACTTCDKTYSHRRDLKHPMQKMYQIDFQIKDAETNIFIPAKRKSRYFETEKELKEKLKRQKLMEDMNKPTSNTDLILFQMKSLLKFLRLEQQIEMI